MGRNKKKKSKKSKSKKDATVSEDIVSTRDPAAAASSATTSSPAETSPTKPPEEQNPTEPGNEPLRLDIVETKQADDGTVQITFIIGSTHLDNDQRQGEADLMEKIKQDDDRTFNSKITANLKKLLYSNCQAKTDVRRTVFSALPYPFNYLATAIDPAESHNGDLVTELARLLISYKSEMYNDALRRAQYVRWVHLRSNPDSTHRLSPDDISCEGHPEEPHDRSKVWLPLAIGSIPDDMRELFEYILQQLRVDDPDIDVVLFASMFRDLVGPQIDSAAKGYARRYIGERPIDLKSLSASPLLPPGGRLEPFDPTQMPTKITVFLPLHRRGGPKSHDFGMFPGRRTYNEVMEIQQEAKPTYDDYVRLLESAGLRLFANPRYKPRGDAELQRRLRLASERVRELPQASDGDEQPAGDQPAGAQPASDQPVDTPPNAEEQAPP